MIHSDMNNRGLNASYITSQYYGGPWVKIPQYMYICPTVFSESLSFWVFPLVAEAPFSSAYTFSRTTANKLKNAHCVLLRKDLRARKWSKQYDWPACLKCNSQLALAQPPECASYWQILSLLLDSSTHGHEKDYFIISCLFVCFFWGEGGLGNDFIMNAIQSTLAW